MAQVLHTFDYELFFGKDSGTPQKCLIEPMDFLLDLFRAKNLTGVIFVDTLYLLKLRNLDLAPAHRDFDLVIAQLKKAADLGFAFGLHMHPHWTDAQYLERTNTWNFPHYENYTLQKLSQSELDKTVQESFDFLEKVSGQKVKIFRAGGWCVEPFSKIGLALQKVGIKIDSSVVPGLKFPNRLQPFDFSRIEPSCSPWVFGDSPSKVDADGGWIEFPVSTYRKAFLARARGYFNKGDSSFGDGLNMYASRVHPVVKITNKLMRPGLGVLTLETQQALLEGNIFVRDQTRTDPESFFVSVTHPKGLQKSPDISHALKESWVFKTPAANLKGLGLI